MLANGESSGGVAGARVRAARKPLLEIICAPSASANLLRAFAAAGAKSLEGNGEELRSAA